MTVDINGLSTKLEVLTSIKENIQDGDTDTASRHGQSDD